MRMDIASLIDSLRGDLGRAAEVGGDDARAAAERLLLALEPALRLTLMDALSQAATELGAAIPGVTVSVRLAGREPMFVVEGAPAAPAAPESFAAADDDEPVARITLRIPEALKTRAEALAAGRGQSLNTWLVAAARAAASDDPGASGRGRHGLSGRHLKGWAR
jgi:hypothetical protein